MNAMTARGLGLAAVVAVWTAISEMARVNLSLWPVIVGLGWLLSGTVSVRSGISAQPAKASASASSA